MEIKNVVEIHDLGLKTIRGEQIFRKLNLILQANRSVVITGAAGSGKSSLVKLLVGMSRPDSGTIKVFNQVLKKKRVIRNTRRRIGGVGGIFQLMPTFTVAENIVFPLIVSGVHKKQRREKLMNALAEFSLLKKINDYPEQLTRVEKTMVQFARATIANQPLIIIDEPSAGLDKNTYERIVDYLVKVSLSGRSMIILTSEVPSKSLPNTDYYQINGGVLS